ncbi:proline-rich domain-containing protein [Paenibacillus sp. JDR-2]|uniref:proline-rich domain-containing protein n=1 Tax=Paenibacillus sp. (strain JDR-2) TaxID=324057 RepID=UPI0001664755|nr:proline-rich domain-containing protein [Paenibacillus sp. JDR-2]ACT03506.1 hypothetical protein Pjdr2_4895 [Paenibacillus sp. JDR-2]
MNNWKIVLSAVAISVALAGCGSKSDESGTAANGTTGQAQQQNQGQQGDFQGRAMMGTIGKIKSINGQTITIYKSSFQRPEGGQAGNPPQGDAAQGDAPNGNPPSGDPQGDAGSAPQAGDGQNSGGGRQRNMENMFSDETMDITVTDATKIVSASFADGKMTETDKTLADLKADDIITVQLKDDTQEAESIRLGGFGGGGFGGGGRGGQFQNGGGAQNGQQQADQQTTTK